MLRWLVAALAALQLGGCASLPAPEPRPKSAAIPVPASTALGAATMRERPFPEASGFRLLRSGTAAFETRLGLIAEAQSSIDIQYYHLAPDTAGLRVVDELRAAAQRGVRVRLLVDDLHTFGTDAALLRLAREPNAEVRLFNPFVGLRGPLATRVLASAWDFGRLNARMHNKLLVADGALAVVGGRNLADAYFDAAGGAAYLDLDVLVAGAVIPDLGVIFDAYWNDDIVYPIGRITEHGATAAGSGQSEWPAAEPGPTGSRHPGLRARAPQRISGQPLGLSWGWAEAFADAPGKRRGAPTLIGGSRVRGSSQMRELIWSEMAEARYEYLILTPYLIPGDGGMRTVRANRARGVKIGIVTNSLASTDEPLVHSGYRRYRRPMLEAGVELYELSAERGWSLGDRSSKGPSYGLHTKAVVFDRDTVYLGSLNFDPRSEAINTEAGLLIRSPELAEEILDFVEEAKRKALYAVILRPDGKTEWNAQAWDTGGYVAAREPAVSFWRRMLIELLGPLIPERLL